MFKVDSKKFLGALEECDKDYLEYTVDKISEEITRGVLKNDENILLSVSDSLSELKLRFLELQNYSEVDRERNMYFYVGVIFAYYELVSMHYAKVKKDKDMDEISKNKNELYKKILAYLEEHGETTESKLAEVLNVRNGSIMSVVGSSWLQGKNEIIMNQVGSDTYFDVSREIKSRQNLERKNNSFSNYTIDLTDI